MPIPVHSCRFSRSPGFTLAEILIAIAIFALLVSIIMGSFSGVFSQTEQLAHERINRDMARNCLVRMSTDLGNIFIIRPPIFVPTATGQEPSPFRFVARDSTARSGDAVQLQFASRAHVDFNGDGRQGIAIIRYYLEAVGAGPEPVYRLRRGDVLADVGSLPEPANDPILCENIRTLNLSYIDAEGESSKEWDSSSIDYGYATPRAVRIRLELAADDDVTVFQTVVPLPLWRPASGKV